MHVKIVEKKIKNGKRKFEIEIDIWSYILDGCYVFL